MIRFLDPRFYDYCLRLRAAREAETQAFIRRRDAAIAKAAVEEQGIGE